MESSDNENLLDDNFLALNQEEKITAHSIKLRKRHFILFLILVFTNITISYTTRGWVGMSITYSTPFASFLVGGLFWGILLSFIFNFIPHKGIPYWKKFMSTSFIIAGILNLIFIIGFVYKFYIR